MPNASRLIVDLIYKAPGTDSAYPNFNPPEQIHVGDYGRINKHTAAFEKEGNIYDPDFAPELEITTNYPPVVNNPDDKIVIVTKGGKGAGSGATANANLAGLAGASAQGHWKFGKGRGAVIVMIKPTLTTIPPGTLRSKLQPLEILFGKAVVTKVWSCPAYALVLTNDSHAEVGFEWSAGEVTGSVGAGGFGKWKTHSSSGVWKHGGEEGESTFFPLFRLEQVKTPSFMDIWKSYRTSPVPAPEGDDTFRLYSPPWRLLDQQGDEIPDEDDDLSSDDD